MQVEIKIDKNTGQTRVIIVAREMTDEVHDLMKRIAREQPQMLAGFDGGTVQLLEQGDIFRVYASEGKVYAETDRGCFVLRLRLYEAEERLDRGCFVRISHSEIVNLRKVRKFDLSLTGTIHVSLSNGTSTYVSRRYVSRIKQVLGI